MKKAILIWALLSFMVHAETYHFASIDKLVEQEVGRIVLPQIYQTIGIEITITPMPGNRAQYEATSGHKAGEIMRIFSYGEENNTVIRVPTPYYHLETMPFVNAQSNIVITDKSQLAQYSIVKVRGVKHTNNITRGLNNVSDVSSTKQMMKLLSDGLVDVALTNTIDGLAVIATLKLNNIKPMPKPLATLDLYHYIHKDHADLVPKVDAAIRALQKSGELQRMIKRAKTDIITSH